MKHTHYSALEAQKFDNDMVKGVTGRVAIGKNDGAPNFCMRIFTIDPGGFTPKHSHDWEHEILIHQGNGKLFKDGEYVDVKAGDIIFVPGNEEHQFKNESDAPFTFACLIPTGVDEL